MRDLDKTIRIAFVTDLHLPALGKKARGVDTYANFSAVVEDIKKQSIDHLIIGGDISFKTPLNEANNYVKRELQNLGIPYDVIPGNHDNPTEIAKCFLNQLAKETRHHKHEIYYVKYIGDQQCIFLDSSSKKVSYDQLAWLDNQLASSKYSPWIFIHHPVFRCNVPYMDSNHKLTNREDILAILDKYDRLIHIFSGHYHVEKIIKQQNIIQYITPSLFVQIDDRYLDFVVYHHTPGYRIIEKSDNYFESNVRYIFNDLQVG